MADCLWWIDTVDITMGLKDEDTWALLPVVINTAGQQGRTRKGLAQCHVSGIIFQSLYTVKQQMSTTPVEN